MNTVYLVYHGNRVIPHRYGVGAYNNLDVVHVSSSEEEAVIYIRKRIDIWKERYTNTHEKPVDVTEFPVCSDIVYMRKYAPDLYTEYRYYQYIPFEVDKVIEEIGEFTENDLDAVIKAMEAEE